MDLAGIVQCLTNASNRHIHDESFGTKTLVAAAFTFFSF